MTSGLIVLALLVAYIYARQQTALEAREQVTEDLVVRLQLVTKRAELSEFPLSNTKSWDQLADDLGLAAGCRVSFIDRRGRVLGDSMVSLERLSQLDSHSERPEVIAALRGRTEAVERYSNTTGRNMLYVAAPWRGRGATLGVVRLALPMTQVEAALNSLLRVLLVAAVIALVVGLIVSLFAAQIASRGIRSLIQVAAQMEEGNLNIIVDKTSGGEVAELGQALERQARSLAQVIRVLRRERDIFDSILTGMKEGVLYLDADAKIVMVNPALRDMLLMTSEVKGKRIEDLIGETEFNEMLDALYDIGSESEEDEEDEAPRIIQGELKIGGLKPAILRVRAQRVEGEHGGVVAVFLDLTETRRLENMRKEFVANVSHELRTPITSIRSASETLQRVSDSRPDIMPRFLDIIDRNAERLFALVEDVLDLSRIESRQFSMSIVSLDVAEAFEKTASLFYDRLQKRGIQLLVSQSEPLWVRADRRGLEHVLTNLTDNAVKYAGVDTMIELSAEAAQGVVVLRVKDNGVGINEKHLSRLFERFFRVDAGRSREEGGTGLGLSIVKHLVESMGGKVSVSSKVGEGTCFSIELTQAGRTDGDAQLPPSARGALLSTGG